MYIGIIILDKVRTQRSGKLGAMRLVSGAVTDLLLANVEYIGAEDIDRTVRYAYTRLHGWQISV
jgi:hypothetical protein